ncbi:hypothetical protein ACLKA7_009911 [Drosophila subpalustris]
MVSSIADSQDLEIIKEKTTRDLIIEHGYPAEHHSVETEDGNMLSVFRIPYSHHLQNENQTRPIVLMQHGLLTSSDIWVVSGPNDSLAFLLADSGFDVWIGNNRGNEYSKPLKTPSWNFSWHEIGYYDLPAMIDYAIKTNDQGQKSIHYVGHSQGTTVFFTLMSLRPEYNERIKTAHMLAPVAIWKNVKSECISCAADLISADGWLTKLLSHAEFGRSMSSSASQCFETKCKNFTENQSSGHSNQTALIEAAKISQVGSWKQVIHYLFNFKSGLFQQYDYDTVTNLELYKSEKPPNYPIEEINSEVHLWYADNDQLVAVDDVVALADRLPKKVLHHIDDPLWAHGDFYLHNEIRKYVNEPVIQIMQQYKLDSK